jgi:hypothetical protein
MGRVRDKKNRQSHREIGEQLRRRRLLVEVRSEAKEFSEGLRRGMDPADAVQIILDNMMSAYEYATQQVWTLQEDEYFTETIAGKRLNEWIVEQERLSLQIVHTAAKAAAMGLAERTVKLQEQQAAIFAAVVERALVQAGVGSEERRSIHQHIGEGLDDLEGTARALPVNAL